MLMNNKTAFYFRAIYLRTFYLCAVIEPARELIYIQPPGGFKSLAVHHKRD